MRASCPRCLLRVSSLTKFAGRGASSFRTKLPSPKITQNRTFKRAYFSANGILDKLGNNVYGSLWGAFFTAQSAVSSTPSTRAIATAPQTLRSSILRIRKKQDTRSPLDPLDRRKALASSSQIVPSINPTIPPDAISTSLPPSSLRRSLAAYLALSKPRLTFLMVLTTATAYSLYPTPALLLPEITSQPSLSALTLVFLTTGTTLCSASANALNMLLEPAHDAKMSRTRNRPLVRGLVSRREALLFALLTGLTGVAGLHLGVNPTVAFLGALNIALYAGVYTPLKRISVANTWFGAVVGGIPPLMGWAGAAGQSATGVGWQELLLGSHNVGGWLLAALLFAWQFPHFNALSWTIRDEYRLAGYRMLAWTNPRMNGRVALRYALLFFPICAGLAWAGVTDWGFVVSSSMVNAWIVREAWRFWKLEGHKGSARGLFWAGVWHLPVVMVLAMVHKKGFWEGVWRRVVGEEEDEMWVLDEDIEVESDKAAPLQSPIKAAT